MSFSDSVAKDKHMIYDDQTLVFFFKECIRVQGIQIFTSNWKGFLQFSKGDLHLYCPFFQMTRLNESAQ